eukprot:gene7477-11801_t
MSGIVENITKASYELQRRKSLKVSSLPSFQEKSIEEVKDPLFFLEVASARRLGKTVNTYCTIVFEGQDYMTGISFNSGSPSWKENFVFKAKDITSSVVITIYSKNVLVKDTFLGQVTLALSDYHSEEIVSKWFQLDSRLDRRDSSLGQILLKFQLLYSERGTMYKLNDYLEVDHYDAMKDYFISIPSDIFCALFDHNKLVPNESEIQALTTILIDTEIKTTKVLQFIIKEEVNSCFSSTTLFRRNSLASKLITSCMKRFGNNYLEKILKGIIIDIITKNENLEVDPMRDESANIEENMDKLIKIVDTILNSIFESVELLPFEIREVSNILSREVESKFRDEQITKLSVGGVIFLRFFCPAIASPLSAKFVDKIPPKNANRTFVLLSKIIQNLANGIQFGQKEPYMKNSNEYLGKKEKEVSKYLYNVVDLSNCKPSSTLDAQKKEVTLLGAFRVTLQELRTLFAFYTIHCYFNRNWTTIYLSLEKEKPDISVRFVEKDPEDVKKFIDAFDKILQTFKEPVELKFKKKILNYEK